MPTSKTAASMSQETGDGAPAADAPEIVSEFPAPPKFFVLYKDGVDQGPAPPEPMEPTYHLFGTPYSTQDVVPDLIPDDKKLYLVSKGEEDAVTAAAGPAKPEADVETTVVDYKAQLKRLNRSLLVNFVELVEVLIKNPALFSDKLNDIELLFLNMHNLINAFRPHQARENIIHMLKAQIQERRDAAQDIRRTIDESRKAVETAHAQFHDEDGEVTAADATDVKMEEAAQRLTTTQHSDAPGSELLSPRSSTIAKAEANRETQQIQEEFFASLDAALE